MHILFVSTSFPRDLRTYVSGGFQRMRMFVDALKEVAHLDVLFYVPTDVDTSPAAVSAWERTLSQHWEADLHLFLCQHFERTAALSKWQIYRAEMTSFFEQPGYMSTSGAQQVQAFEHCLHRKPDAIFVHKLPAMCPPLLTHAPLPPIFFDLDDIEHVALLRSINRRWAWRTKLLQYAHVPTLLWGERRAMRLAHRTFVCSELDRNYLTKWWRLAGIVTVPNTANALKLLPLASSPTLLFVGSFAYQPNVEAAEFLLKQVWPHIYRTMPEARLIIAGTRPARIRGYDVGVPGVEFTGFVDDLEELYQRSRVVCAPILAGSGTRIKIIEAASYGKAIVATRVGAEGLDMRDGVELLLRDDPGSFADACLQLLNDAVFCERLGHAAYATVVRCYDRANIVSLIQRYLKEDYNVESTGS
jgi:glycosyltransferase involved in cell wall biosynthesis